METKTITKHAVDAIKHAAEMLCGTKLEATQSLNKEIARFGELLLELDVINDDRDADTFDSILDYLISELGVENTDKILKVAYKEA